MILTPRLFCVETVVFPHSSPSTPGVPFQTFDDPSARRSSARGVTVTPVPGDVERLGVAGTSSSGMPSYTSSCLPIRFTNEHVELSEGASFRISVDADWLETDMISIEFRLLCRTLSDGDHIAAPLGRRPSVSEEEASHEGMKEVSKVTLYAKCASAKGGLHRFHPLVFGQPYLCSLDVTLHMALTAINHPGGPAGLAAAIVANAFPSEDGVVAPRTGISPVKASTPSGCRTRPRATTVGRCTSIDRPTPVRPRFRTPGRSRRRIVGGTSGTIGWGGSYGNGGGSSSCESRPRVPMTADALEVAATAAGLATALGYTTAKVDADQDGTARDILRAAELLYSRHALGLKWSQGTLKVAEVEANSAAAEVAAAREAATAAAAAAKRSRTRRKSEDAGSNSKGVAEGSSLDVDPAAGSGGARGVSNKSPGRVRVRVDSSAPVFSEAKGADEAAGTSADEMARRGAVPTAGVPKDSLSSLIQVRPTMWSKPEVALDADDEGNEAWTWMPSSPQVRTGARKVPLPSDVRQLSRIIHRRLTEESTVCSRSWASFASATFQSGRRALVTLREEWVEDTRRAWSGQSLEYVTVNRVDLLKLEETFFESDGFLLLRARAGVRLRQHASPTGGGDHEGVAGKRENGTKRLFRRRSSRRRCSQDSSNIVPALAPEEIAGGFHVASGRTPSERSATVKSLPPSDEGAGAGVSASERSRGSPGCISPVGLEKMKIPPYVLSPSVKTMVDGRGGGCSGEKYLVEMRPSSLKSMETAMVLATSAGISKVSTEQFYPWDGMDGSDCEEEDLDGSPPVLEVLERKKRRPLSSSMCTPRGGLGGGGSGVFTPKSCTSSSWGGSSPWRSGSLHHVEHGWFSRLTAGTGGGGSSATYGATGGAPSPIGGGVGGFGAGSSKLLAVAGPSSGVSMSRTGSGLWTGVGIGTGSFGPGSSSAIPSPKASSPRKVVMNLPPPPMSMLPVFDRKLHGYEPSGATDEKWGELPFVVVESWGGLEEKEGDTSTPDASVPPTSPRVTLGANEFRLFREIALTPNWQGSPTKLLALPKGISKGGGSSTGTAVSDGKDTSGGMRGRDDAVVLLNPKAVSSAAEVAEGSKTAGKVNGCAGVNPSFPRLGLAVTTATATALPPVKVPPSPVALPPPSPPSSTRSRAPPDTPSRAPFADIPLVPPTSRSVSVNNAAAIGMGILTPGVMRDKQAPSPVRISLGTPTARRLPSPVRMSSALSGPKHPRPSKKHERGPSRSPVKLHAVTGAGKQAARLAAAAAAAAAVAATSAAAAASNKGGSRTPEKSLARRQKHKARPPGNTATSPSSIWDQTPVGDKESRTKVHRPQFEIGKRHTGHKTTSLPPRGDAALSLQEDTDQGDGESSAMTDSSAATVKSRSKGHGGGSRHRRNVHRRAKSTASGLIARAESIGAEYFSDDFSDSIGAGTGVAGGRKRKGRMRRRTKRAEIRRRMWGKSPDGATAPLALPASQPTSGATSAASATSAGESDVGSERSGAKSTPAGGAGASPAGGARGKAPSEAGANHLIVLVHGLGGRPADMALMRGYLQAFMPGAELMVATSLQDMRKDNLGVEALGQRLASEVHAHITRFCPYFASQVIVSSTLRRGGASDLPLPLSPVTPIRPQRGRNRGGSLPGTPGDPYGLGGSEEDRERSTSRSQRSSSGNGGMKENAGGSGAAMGNGARKGMLSFVCFSMGGLVTRSALLEPEMVPYLSSLQCFVTLACPHLGQTSTPLSFFKTGAWAVRKLTGLRVLHELDLDDAEDPRETALYRLSFSPGLERFRTIVFAANPRDGFVPLHSAAVRSPPLDSTSRTRDAASEMAEMLMSRLDERQNRVVRITVDDPRRQAQSRGTLDTVIGRAGHMCFIDSPQVAWLISLTLLPFMEEKR